MTNKITLQNESHDSVQCTYCTLYSKQRIQFDNYFLYIFRLHIFNSPLNFTSADYRPTVLCKTYLAQLNG